MNNVAATPSRSHLAGWAAVVSGVIGLLAFVFLILVLALRLTVPRFPELMFRIHDAGVIAQSLLMIPVAFALDRVARERSAGQSPAVLALGVGALLFVVLLLGLIFANAVWDVLYMVPQGVLGIWLIVINRRLSGVLPRGLTRFGIICGIGLLLCGTFPLAYAAFVDSAGLHGAISDAAEGPSTPANGITHIVLLIGTFMGVATFPIWSVLLGRRLLRAGAA
jgi:hypothetical protein